MLPESLPGKIAVKMSMTTFDLSDAEAVEGLVLLRTVLQRLRRLLEVILDLSPNFSTTVATLTKPETIPTKLSI